MLGILGNTAGHFRVVGWHIFVVRPPSSSTSLSICNLGGLMASFGLVVERLIGTFSPIHFDVDEEPWPNESFLDCWIGALKDRVNHHIFRYSKSQ